MKVSAAPHRWSVTPKQAVAIQRRLADRVRVCPLASEPRVVAGCDLAFTPDGAGCIAGVVLWDRRRRTEIESHVVHRPVGFPYVPGLLSFREAPALLAALRRLRRVPDAVIFDGHGLAHPRRFGIACHVGLILGIPSLGCAKSRLVGEHLEPGRRRGAARPLRHQGQTIGRVVRTRDGVRPVFVSVGHAIDLPGAVELTLGCTAGYRLPEPTRLADRLVAVHKRAKRSGWAVR